MNALATLEAWRGRGVARLLMADAERAAQAAGCDEIALIVAGENTPAWRLYADLGYRTLACLPLVPYPGAVHGGDWELQVKSLR